MRVIISLFGFFGLLALGAYARPLPEPLPGTADTITLSGAVSEESGMLAVWIPLRGARIIVLESNPLIMAPVPVYNLLDTAFTDSTGAYRFNQLVVAYGTIIIQVSCRGYHDTTVTLSTDSAKANKTYLLNPKLRKIAAAEKCIVTGRILKTSSGHGQVVPVPNTRVEVTPSVIMPLDWWWGGPVASYSAFTDTQGYYSIIAAVDADTEFFWSAVCDGYQPAAQTIVLRANDTTQLGDTFMEPMVTAVPPLMSRPVENMTATVYPQPARSAVTLHLPPAFTREGNVVLSLFDPQGRLLGTRSTDASHTTITVPTPGVYLLRVVNRAGLVLNQTIQCIK